MGTGPHLGVWARIVLALLLLLGSSTAQESRKLVTPDEVGLPDRFPLPIKDPVVQKELRSLLPSERGTDRALRSARKVDHRTNRRLKEALEFFERQPGRKTMLRRIRRGSLPIYHFHAPSSGLYGMWDFNGFRSAIFMNTALCATLGDYVQVLDHEYKHAAGFHGSRGRVGSELDCFRSESRLALRNGLKAAVAKPLWVARASDRQLRRYLIDTHGYSVLDDALYHSDREWRKEVVKWYRKECRLKGRSPLPIGGRAAARFGGAVTVVTQAALWIGLNRASESPEARSTLRSRGRIRS